MALTQALGPAEIQRLKDLVYEGVKVKEEVESLNEGMNETVKAISEELQIPAKLLKTAITVAHKGNFKDHEEDLKDLEAILTAIGRK